MDELLHTISIQEFRGGHYFKCTCGHAGHLEESKSLAEAAGAAHAVDASTPATITISTSQFAGRKILRQLKGFNIEHNITKT